MAHRLMSRQKRVIGWHKGDLAHRLLDGAIEHVVLGLKPEVLLDTAPLVH